MLRRLTRCASSALLVGGALLGATLSPAAAAPTHWVLDSSRLQADAGWTSLGRVAGLPGNAHSGFVFLDTDESAGMIRQSDWTCPAGVRPPIDILATTSCTLIRFRDVSGASASFEGPLRYRLAGPTTVETYTEINTDPVVTSESMDLVFSRTGPITRSVEVADGLKTVTLSAPMRMLGHIGASRFPTPRLAQSVDYFTRTFFYVRG